MGVRHSEQMEALRTIENWQRWAADSALNWPHTIAHVSALHEWKFPTGEWLLKSKNSAGGLGIQELGASDLEKVIPDGKLIDPYYLQRKVQGQNVGVTFLSCRHGHMIMGCVGAAARQRRNDLPKYIYQGSLGPLAISYPDCLGRFAEIVGQETGIMGLWQADFVVNEQGWTLLEINPRWTSSMELIDSLWNVRLVDLHVQSCLQSLDKQVWTNLRRSLQQKRQPSGGINKAIKYAHFDFEVSAWQSNFWWSHRWLGNPDIEDFRLADIPPVGMKIARGQPVLSVYTRCDHPYREWDEVWEAKLSPVTASSNACREPIAARNLN
jgi:predicted ATP-grasp superfamily ATP-dependent carboligase